MRAGEGGVWVGWGRCAGGGLGVWDGIRGGKGVAVGIQAHASRRAIIPQVHWSNFLITEVSGI